MSSFDIGVAMFAGAVILIMLRMPVGVAMLLVGGLGYAALVGWWPMLNTLKSLTFSCFSSYTLCVIPFFLLMGELATKGGMSAALFRAARAYVGHRRGGLGVATILGCAAFGAICGSSLATVATMTKVAEPEMRANGYSGALMTGTLAAGGTLGILIPPSVILVIYAIYTEQSIGALFFAAAVPGVLAALGYVLVIQVYTLVAPGAAPRAERVGWSERLARTRSVWPAIGVFLLVVCGINFGWFSPTEGAAVGAAAVGVLAVASGGLTFRDFLDALRSTAEITAMVFLILLGAELFSAALALSQMPQELSREVAALPLPPIAIVAAIVAIYLVLGCAMESLAMVLLTLPVFVPVMLTLDLGMDPTQVLVWFGILVLVAVEVGMISPPFGLNLFVINGLAKEVPLGQTYKGVAGFCVSDTVRLVLLIAFPGLSLWLPGLW
ncbi:C4-dicarboxylate ABC transporter permease [Acuticoccus sediminis]|uniref:TRAP transporter large permease protein n=1 Tax=Acuticoccus sediminis TaxID=2184697 RepID=A0A8B2NSH5_9HYPH|nr:TRAP transporter large permease [Acuticoccus sediminis]RAI01009.1 C4-dicarboxylate ABC transporter permease [Acuticoccus sediminis]